MDLDNIKKTWQETEIKPAINDEKIEKMISNEGQSALGKLLWYEKLGLWLSLPCSLILILVWYIHLALFVMFAFLLILALIWQIYKLNFLKRLDVVNMNMLVIASHVNRYKLYINREMIAGIIILFIFFAFYTYFTTDAQDYSTDVMKHMAIRFFAAVIAGAVVALLVYRYIYLKNIKKLEASVREVEEFEKDNQ